MKKIALLAVLLCTLSLGAQAQAPDRSTHTEQETILITPEKNRSSFSTEKNAIGGKLFFGFPCVTYQHSINRFMRLNFDLGMLLTFDDGPGVSLTGAYQFVTNMERPFRAYAGVGHSLGVCEYYSYYYDYFGFAMGPTLQWGFEYKFKIPLILSLDFGLTFNLMDGDAEPYVQSAGFGLKYTF